MRVLVTGGCGFLGAAVVRQAIERGDHVLNLDRRRKATPCPQLGNTNGAKGYARIETDVSDRMLMRSIFREFKPDAVIHLAAAGEEKDDARIYDSEVGAAFSVMEASRAHLGTLQGEARKKFRIVQAVRADSDVGSSGKITPHDAARVCALQLIESWSHAQELPLVTCVAGDVFGPWQRDDTLMSQLVAGLLRTSKAQLTHGGAIMRDWLPLRDFADGILCAAQAGAPLSRIDFSAGAERRDIELADALCALLDIRSPLPNDASWSSLVEIIGNPVNSPGPMLDDTEAELTLGWKPRGFHAGLDRMLNWAMTRYAPTHAAIAAE
jgi:dTDP-glucose 4,6-dehydratase